MDANVAVARPTWRGRLHQVAFFLSLPAGLSLIVLAESFVARMGAGIYALSLSAMYAASAAFHRLHWAPRTLSRMARLDHSMIFVMIAGTYTPFALLALPPPWSTVILAFAWGGAALGVALRLASQRLTALLQSLYLILGWVGVIALPLAAGRLSAMGAGLMIAGGLFYTVGAVLFWLRLPRLRPQVFGYHEVWHVMVVAGSACHYALIMLLISTG